MIKKLGTLKVKFPIVTFCTYFTLISVILIACYFRFYQNMVASYDRLGQEILNLAAEDINIDNIPDYMSGHYDKKEYSRTQKKLDYYPQCFHEIFYLYAYQLNGDGATATYLFDAQTDHDEPYDLGELYELEDDIRGQIAEHGAGNKLDTVMDNTQWGYLMTCSKPLYDSKGEFQGYLLVDFDLTQIREENMGFILKLALMVFGLMLVIFYISMKTVSARLTRPLEQMYVCLSDFQYATHMDREENIRKLKELKIHTNQEIQSLYEALLSNAEDSYLFMNEYRHATEKLGVANEKAYTDVLTGVRNKTAYEDRSKELQNILDRGEPLEIAVIMADINNLKFVNDQFGHKRGDEYIKGCCDILTNMCRHSLIYRIGGDEFVIILEGADYRGRRILFETLRMHYHDLYTDETSEPWERYSASLGMSEYQSTDTSFSEILKRADSAMYQSKSVFKEKYGSYR